MNTRLVGIGITSLALLGGGSYFALAQPGGQPEPKRAEPKGEEGAEEVEVKLADAPAAVRAAIAKLAPADKVKKVVRSENDEDVYTYEVEYTADGMDCSADLAAGGEVMALERVLKEGAVPGAVMGAVRKAFPNGKVERSESVQEFFYEVTVVLDGKKQGVKVNAAGEIQNKRHGEEDEQAEEREEREKGKGK